MDWDLAIKRNSKALKGIIEVLFALLGLDGTDAASRIPRSLHSAVLGVLRPAESAVRRLIVVAARNVVVKPRHGRSPRCRSAPAILPATGENPFTRSMKSSSSATGSPRRR